MSASQNLFIIAYILVFYAAFMTRSGVLGSVSVHSFGEGAAGKFLGILVIVLVSAYFILLIFNILRKRKIAKIKTFEQDIFSKKSFYELTLFLTIAILILSAFHIFFNTSIPLFNFIFKLSLALPPDIIAFYNKWQSLFLILLFILMIFYFVKLQLKSSAKKRINIYILLLSVISIVLIILSTKDIKLYPNLVLLILSLICVIILLSVIIYARVKLHIILIHIGISIFFLGVILAFGNTKKIYNLDAKDNNSNLIKLDKGEKVRTSAGIIKYVGFDVYKDKSFYKINFQKVNSAKNIVFTPVLLHDQMHGDVFEPSVHKTLWGDYFIHTVKTSINPFRPNLNYSKEDTLWLEIGKSIKYNGLNISLLRVETDASGYETDFDNIVLDAVLKVENGINDTLVYASYVVEKGELFHNDAVLEYPELFIRFNTISPDSPSVQLKISEKITDNILIKAEYFPFINFVWLGLLISLLGLLLSFQKKIIKS